MVAELQSKVEKYETRASQCEEQARGARDKARQTFYEGLASYYSGLATDFRKVIEKRKVVALGGGLHGKSPLVMAVGQARA